MKNLWLLWGGFLTAILIIVLSCNQVKKIESAKIEIKDTVILIDSSLIRQQAFEIKNLKDSILKLKRDTLFVYPGVSYEDYMNGRRIQKIKYYIAICDKKSSQKKFLYGWIKRTLKE